MTGANGRLLVVDDEAVALKNLAHVLEREGHAVTAATSGEEALEHLQRNVYDVVLTDLRMKGIDGMELLGRVKGLAGETEVVLITGYATLPSAVEAMKKGAFYYVSKPFRLEEVRQVVREAVEKVHLKRENRALKEEIRTFRGNVRIIAENERMQQLLGTARQVAPTDCTVLITGESGTGKELLARYVHRHSQRAGGPFLAINCGAFTPELLSNELFGHERGAFTGASGLKRGLVEVAKGGTLVLDEITEMPAGMQVKLLRVVQERELLRIGGTQLVPIDVRFIASTNRDIHAMVRAGEFRNDLYYRLNVVLLELPPLRERRDDIEPLIHHFLRKWSALMDKDVREVAPEVLRRFETYDFPGNVRELENIIERGVALAHEGVIEYRHLPPRLVGGLRSGGGGPRLTTLQEQEMAHIRFVLDQVGGNKTAAAEILGIDRVSLWRKLKRFGLEPSGNADAPKRTEAE